LDFLVSILVDDFCEYFCDAEVVVYCLCCCDDAYVAYLSVGGLVFCGWVCCVVVLVFVVYFVICFVWY
jgi:hypothetical protein